MNKRVCAVLVVACLVLVPAGVFGGLVWAGGVWFGLGFLNAGLLGAFSWDPLTGALVVLSGPLGLADTFRTQTSRLD